MRNALFAGLTAALLSVGTITPAFAGQYSDSNKISDWSADHIEILTELGVITGYPDGTFRPAENVTREEMAVMLLEGMIALEAYIADSMWANDIYLYEELVAQQTQLLQALAAIDELTAKEAIEKNNFIALSVIYNAEDDAVDDSAYISLDAKFQILSLSDTFKLSIRPFVNTTGEAGAAATLDAKLGSKITVGAGMGYAGSWNNDSALAGDSDGVAYGQANIDFSPSKNTVITLGAKVPVQGENSGDINFGLGFGVKF